MIDTLTEVSTITTLEDLWTYYVLCSVDDEYQYELHDAMYIEVLCRALQLIATQLLSIHDRKYVDKFINGV